MDKKDKDDIYLNLLNKIQEQSKETQNTVIDLDKKVDLHIQKTEYELSRINALDEEQNQLIDEHIAGVKTLKGIYEEHKKENDVRFQALEEPRKVFAWLFKATGIVGVICGAIFGAIKLIAFFI